MTVSVARALAPVVVDWHVARLDVVRPGQRQAGQIGLRFVFMQTQSKLDWLRDHAAPMQPTVVGDDDFADLKALDDYLDGVRVVQLGEQTHGDGTCFELKVRMIRYLHQRHGFEVLGWESGLYSCHIAYQEIAAGRDVVEAAELGLFPVWTRSRQVRPLLDYVQAQADTCHPLELWGIDSQLSGHASRDRLPEDLRARGCDLMADQLTHMLKAAPPVGDQARAVQDQLEQASARETDPFWKQCLRSLAAESRGRQAQAEAQDLQAHSRNRDRQMGLNLIWLANTMYPDKKIVVWIDSGHASHSFRSLVLPEDAQGFNDYDTSGNVARQELGRELLTVHFTAGSGAAGHSDGPPKTFGVEPLKTLGPPPADSFEDLCARAGLQDSLVDLRPGSGAPWMGERTTMRQGGYTDREAVWPDLFDAVVFHPVMEPSSE